MRRRRDEKPHNAVWIFGNPHRSPGGTGGTLHQYTHEKTGARLCWIERAEENKTFAIAFRTIPTDDTGVFHILEHSVLCGSEKYPVKEPFVGC